MKHLQSDLSSLFKPSTPTLATSPLPSGKPYVRPLKLSTRTPLGYYTYRSWVREITYVLPDPIDVSWGLELTRPRIPTKKLDVYRTWAYQYIVHGTFDDSFYSPKFRTSDEAYIDMFLQLPSTCKLHPVEFTRIISIYPEYFI